MKKFIKQSELQAVNSLAKIAKLNLLETGIHLATADTNVGFAAMATLAKVLKEKKLSQLQMYEFMKECCAMLATIVTKIQERSPLKSNFTRKLVSLDPRLIVAEPDTAVKMFKQVLTNLVDTKWGTTEQADGILTQYKKFVSEMKQFHHVERGFSVNKETLAPKLKENSLKAICLVQDIVSAKQIEIAQFVITDELLTSCSHANNRYKMYLMDKVIEAKEPEKARKRKPLQEELTAAKKGKKELDVTAQKLAESADKKAEEAVKKTDVATMTALLIESNTSRKKT